VEGNRRRDREGLVNSRGGEARGRRRGAIQLKALPGQPQWYAGQRGNRVDAAGAQEDEACLVPLAVFEQVQRAIQVVLDQLTAAGTPIDAGEDTWIGGGINDPIGRRQAVEVGGGAHIAVADVDSERAQARLAGLAAGAEKVVDS